MTDNLTLEDLAKYSGLPLRTLRFYIQEGLLPGPDTHGKYARYSQKHLERLEWIKRMKNLRLPLHEIRHLLNSMRPGDIDAMFKKQDASNYIMEFDNEEIEAYSPANPASSALEYIRGLEASNENVRSIVELPVPPVIREKIAPLPSPIPPLELETWNRIVIGDGIELNIRGPRGTVDETKVRKLVTFARELFGDQLEKGEKGDGNEKNSER